ncbi:MAG: hypothetical protein IJ562_07750 [Prevotella sp.]|nr:hypothetical protein [Prevotella sp.]
MTFKELLDSVQFEDVAPHIVRMYPDMENSIGWYKIHFDMLRLMNPVYHKDANDKVCRITMKDWEDGSGLHLNAYPMEGDLWEHSLTKELIIAPEVKASNEELAACCLWHTSFHGFVEKQVNERFRIYDLDMATLDRWNNSLYYKVRAMRDFSIIREHGGIIPTIRQLSKLKKAELIKQSKESIWFGKTTLNKIKRKKRFRIEFLEHYYERMTVIGDFIVHAITALKDARNYMSVEQLCGLFHSELFCTEEIMSFASDGESGAKYLYDLLTSYDMIPKMDGIVVRLVTGTECEVLTEDENLLCNLLAEGRKYGDLILDYDPVLGNQVVISYAAYNSNNPLVK